MSVRVRDGSGLNPIAAIKYRGGSGLLNVATGRVRDGSSGLLTFFTAGGGGAGGFAVTPTNGTVSKTQSTIHPTPNPKTITTPAYTLTVAGAVAPTFAWSRVSGDAGITAGSPAANPTTFSKSMALDSTASAVFKCVVTDGGAVQTVFVTVNLSIEFVDIGGPE